MSEVLPSASRGSGRNLAKGARTHKRYAISRVIWESLASVQPRGSLIMRKFLPVEAGSN